ncbi:MAG: hypothetical protein ABI947_15305 [Chloroflexota bacterium]
MTDSKFRTWAGIVLIAVLLVTSAACNFPALTGSAVSANSVVVTATPSPTLASLSIASIAPILPTAPPIPTLVPLVSTIAINIASASMTPVAPVDFVEPQGCERPPDSYTRTLIGGAKLNARTVWMLNHAQQLFNGTLNFTGIGITQGSYNPGGVTASFGTHDGGGAVDLSVIKLRTGQVMRSELPDAIRALRIAGFAAWVREPNDLYKGSPIHIHAIAIGDAELSPAARDQLTGTFGYFLGYDGLPNTQNIPGVDRHGGPILCQWMIAMGYRDMRK